jgi:hypothetical protein
MQVAVPPKIASGWPFEVTRVVPTVNCAVTHGPPELGGKGQPAIDHCDVSATVGCPPALTFGFGVIGVARPPCAH